jgi:hypothetical protein
MRAWLMQVNLCDKENLVILPPDTAKGPSSKAGSKKAGSSSTKRLVQDSGRRDCGSIGYRAPEVQEALRKGDPMSAVTRAATWPAELFSIALTTLSAALRCPEKVLLVSCDWVNVWCVGGCCTSTIPCRQYPSDMHVCDETHAVRNGSVGHSSSKQEELLCRAH